MKNRRIAAALRDAGAVLVRQSKHLVYQFPNGATVTMSVSPSDHRVERNILADIRRAVRTSSAGHAA